MGAELRVLLMKAALAPWGKGGENLKADLTAGTYRYMVTPMKEKSGMDKRYPFWLPKELYQQAQKKSGLIPLAAVIRTLLAMWVRGEVELKTQQERKE